MKKDLESFKKALCDAMGSNWVKAVTDEEILYFRDFCALTSVYSLEKDEYFEQTCHAFRGFVTGRKFRPG